MHWLWSIANYQISVQIEIQAYVKTFSVNNDISNIHVHRVEPDLCVIKVGCPFFGTPCSVDYKDVCAVSVGKRDSGILGECFKVKGHIGTLYSPIS